MTKNKDSSKFKKKFINLVNRILIVALMSLIVLILCKKDIKIKNYIYEKVYNTHFKFNYFNNLYNKYLGNIVPLKGLVKNEEVFNEKLTYKSLNKYKDGVKLQVSNKYMVPALNSGIVVFVGNKEGYGKCVIVQQINGVNVWYGNINSDVKTYDYIEKGSLIGEAINNYIYLVFEKDGKIVNYKKYI